MWRAHFNDGKVLEEFDGQGKEVLFKNVSARVDELEKLSVTVADKIYTVRMADGRFSTISNGEEYHFFAQGVDGAKLSHIRPIYFIREYVNFGTQGEVPVALGPPEVEFTALGFQADLYGRNVKRYLAIFPGGNIVLKDT